MTAFVDLKKSRPKSPLILYVIVIADVQHILNELKGKPNNILFQWICYLKENAYIHPMKDYVFE